MSYAVGRHWAIHLMYAPPLKTTKKGDVFERSKERT